MFLNVILLILGFVFLIKGADLLVNGASSLAKKINVPDIVIGLTIIAMGTSAPELTVNLLAAGNGSQDCSDIVFGNVIGSNIFNLYLILGLSSIVFPLTVDKSTLIKEIPFLFVVSLIFLFLVNDILWFGDDQLNQLDFFDSIVLIGLFALFLIHIYFSTRGANKDTTEFEDIEKLPLPKTLLMIVVGIAGLIIGGNFIIDNVVFLAEEFNISKKIIGLTMISLGTSLPELATSLVAAFQKKPDLAIGNILGSNIFNILLVLGASALAHNPLNYNINFNFDLFVSIFGVLLLAIFMFTQNKLKLDRFEGLIYLIFCCVYLFYLFVNM